MASPEPPVALKDHCSIIHENTLYVYSPDAFQTLSLSENATWTQEENGVAVTGALCVKGGLDGDGNNPVMYVVGGSTNGSTSNYSGIQRYSIREKKWQTITPMSTVTANRKNHGATYLNASSAILVYGGSQNDDAGFSTETFLMLMYPPYRVQAYSSIAPAVKQPFLLPFTDDKGLMVGGGNGNKKVFTFHPDPGWVDLGVALPDVLPDPSVAQVSLQSLTDGSRILQTFFTNESPNRVTRNVLTNPGFVPAAFGQTIGSPPSKSKSRMMPRQLNQGNYPTYNDTNAPVSQRTGTSLASDSDVIALVGGDSNSTVSVFNATSNSWVDSAALFGDIQKPLTVSSSTSTTSSAPTATSSEASATSSTSAKSAASSDDGQSNSLAILGGVLGAICGVAAITIIVLLWLRSRKRRRNPPPTNKQNDSNYPDDKQRGMSPGDRDGSTPLSQQAQPMGRSPVPSAIIGDRDSMAMFSGNHNEKSVDVQNQGGSKLNPNHGGFFKSNNKTPLTISKPMLPDLGDYQERPSIDLGKATPSGAPVLPPIGVDSQKADQRKTDEGWAKYFQADTEEKPKPPQSPYAVNFEDDPRRSTSRPSTAKGGGGFWPGAGVASNSRTNKLPSRDSDGNLLTHAMVPIASPSLAVGHENPTARKMSVAPAAIAKISRADSVSTDRRSSSSSRSTHSSDDGYEDDEVDAYSEARDSSYQQNAWNPIGSTWSGPSQRPLRPPSVRVGASAYPPPPPTGVSEMASNSSTSGESSIPAFPLPAASIGRAGTTDQYVETSTVERSRNPYAPANLYASKNPYAPKNTFSPTNPYAHARKSSNAMQFHGGPPVQDYFGPPPGTASSQGTFGQGHDQKHDSNDMSWLNLGTPAHAHVHAHARGSTHSGNSQDPA